MDLLYPAVLALLLLATIALIKGCAALERRK
jgi:hypothetical protein